MKFRKMKALVLSLVVCMVAGIVTPVSAFTSGNFLTIDFSEVITDENNKVTNANGQFAINDGGGANTAVYYNSADDVLSITCDNNTNTNNRNNINKQTTATTEALAVTTKLDLSGQTGPVKFLLRGGYASSASAVGTTQGETVVIDANGAVTLCKESTGIELSKSEEYDMTLKYIPAVLSGESRSYSIGEATVSVSFTANGKTQSFKTSVSGFDALNLYNIAGLRIYVMKPDNGELNTLKLTEKISMDTIAGIEKTRTEYFSHNFDSDTEVLAPTGVTYLRIGSNGNIGTLIGEAAGAKSGNSLKVEVGTQSAQYRVNHSNITACVPVGFETSFKLDNFVSGAFKLTLFGKGIISIDGGGGVSVTSYDDLSQLVINKGEWYTIKGAYNPISGLLSLMVYDADDAPIAGCFDVEMGTGTWNANYMQLLFSPGVTGYLDNISLYSIDNVIGVSDSFGVKTMSPAYGAKMAVDKAVVTFTKGVDTTDFAKNNISVTCGGIALDSFEYSWNDDKTELTISNLTQKGKYEINVLKAKNGSDEVDAYMEFETMNKPVLGNAVFVRGESGIAATVAAPYQMDNIGKITLFIAGYDGDSENGYVLKEIKPVTGNADGTKMQSFSAELSGSEYAKIRAFVFDGGLKPLKPVSDYIQN